MNLSKRFIVWALTYAVAGLSLGIYMAASGNHGEIPAHAHILLIGFVVNFIYGIIHRLWLVRPNRALATSQFFLHQAAAIVISVGLFLVFGGFVPEPTAGPVLGVAAVGVLIGMLMMLYMVIRFGAEQLPA
ncbi:MAG TPA: TonB-dependent receptor [Candidatus Dormibacteraeota bacterium]|nr:TonB-dependent receptor [Candidatus Dormibacteraeota bacterium]